MKIAKEQNLFSNLGFIFNNLKEWDPAFLMWALLRVLCISLGPVFAIFMPKLIIDSLTTQEQSFEQTAMNVMLLSLAILLTNILARYTETRIDFAGYNSRAKSIVLFTLKTLKTDYINLESQEGQMAREKALRAINWDGSGAQAIVNHSVYFIGHCLSLALYAIIVGRLNILIIIGLAIGAAISFVAMQRARRYEAQNNESYFLAEKQRYYGIHRIHEFTSAKDIRLFHMQDWLLQVMNRYIFEQTSWLKRMRLRYSAADSAALLVNMVRDGAAYIYLTSMVSDGSISIGDYSLMFAAVAGISNWLNLLLQDLSSIDVAQREVSYLREYLDFPDQEIGEAEDAVPPAVSVMPEIVFENVTFKYPHSAKATLQNFSLSIRSGEKVALVGLNGAGKTTCVKLLLGLYRPTSGRILIDGQDTAHMAQGDLYALFAPVFQDVWIVPFDIEQNVSTQLKEETDRARVRECLEKAGLGDKVAHLPQGLETPLTRAFDDNGILLSGGETQKLMLARALYKDAPIVVMDEPTAALDPLAEAELYESYNDMVGRKTSLYISHRLSSTRFCDRIALLAEGRVRELGSHEQLLALNGEYAKLYEVQSRYYQDTFKDETEQQEEG